jgi:hypothetical protein
VQDGIEFEDLIDEDDRMKIIRIFHRRDNLKMFLLERKVENEKEHIEFVQEIQRYESLSVDGLVNIERWVPSYDVIIVLRHAA